MFTSSARTGHEVQSDQTFGRWSHAAVRAHTSHVRFVTCATVGLATVAMTGCGSGHAPKPAASTFSLVQAKTSATNEVFRRLALAGVITRPNTLDGSRAIADAPGVRTGDPLRLESAARTPGNGYPGWYLTYKIGSITVCVQIWRAPTADQVGAC